jgi:hypothetical protein
VTDKNSIDGVKEIELAVNDFSTACELITNLGLLPGPYQENFRETWELNDCLVTIDEWPGLEPFIEIEGESEEVVMAAIGLLEINPEEAVYGSVDFLYEDIHNISPKKFNKIKRLDFENYKSVLSGTAIKRKSRYNIKCSKK